MRVIGIRHRVKKTTKGEARPTQVAILEDGREVVKYDLDDDTAELDWLLGQYPTAYRKAEESDNLANFRTHQVHWKELKKADDPSTYPPNLIRREGKDTYVATKMPAEYDGLKIGDTVAMCLGGSGDRLACALSRRADELGQDTKVVRLPPFTLEKWRGAKSKDEDAQTLAELAKELKELFLTTTKRDRELIRLREAYRARVDAMKARIACEQRLRQHMIGGVFCSEEGRYPEGSIEDAYDKAKANDKILTGLLEEEKKREKDVIKAIESFNVYTELFEPITGVGPMIAARLIVAIGDIRRFQTKAKLKAFCGVHLIEGQFARRRGGQVSNWQPEARQALYLLSDQFNRRPNSPWGQALLHWKKVLRARHPEVIVVEGKKRYTDGHIHKMALWRTVTKFVEWLFRAWWWLERDMVGEKPVYTPGQSTYADGAQLPPSSAVVDPNQIQDPVVRDEMRL